MHGFCSSGFATGEASTRGCHGRVSAACPRSRRQAHRRNQRLGVSMPSFVPADNRHGEAEHQSPRDVPESFAAPNFKSGPSAAAVPFPRKFGSALRVRTSSDGTLGLQHESSQDKHSRNFDDAQGHELIAQLLTSTAPRPGTLVLQGHAVVERETRHATISDAEHASKLLLSLLKGPGASDAAPQSRAHILPRDAQPRVEHDRIEDSNASSKDGHINNNNNKPDSTSPQWLRELGRKSPEGEVDRLNSEKACPSQLSALPGIRLPPSVAALLPEPCGGVD